MVFVGRDHGLGMLNGLCGVGELVVKTRSWYIITVGENVSAAPTANSSQNHLHQPATVLTWNCSILKHQVFEETRMSICPSYM